MRREGENMKLSIVVPCYNESECIELFYEEILKVMHQIPEYELELLFVNDGSKDNTLEILQSLHKKDSQVVVVNFSRNFGKEAALLAGLEFSTGDLVAVMDADMQDPPELLIEMVGYLQDEYDVVYTRRKNRNGEPPIRSFFAKLFYKLINKMSEVEIVDGARDYRMMKRYVVDSILQLKERCRFSKGLFVWVGFNSKIIEFEHTDRAKGKTKWSFGKLFRYGIEGMVSFSNFPLRIASILGIVISVVAFIYMLYIVIKALIFKNPVAGWASMTSIILFIGGVQLVLMGIIGEYLGHMFTELKGRPNYIVKSIYKKIEENK